ncbi:MAG: ribosome maturation factor RimM [Bacteroidales bacterium]
MQKEKCFYLGKIIKPLGYKGEVVIYIDTDDPEEYKNIDSVFIDIRGRLVPFFVERTELRNKNNQLTIKFHDIDNEEDALSISGSEIFLPLDLLPHLEGNAFYFHEIEGFDVTDREKGNIGKISKVLDHRGNPLFEIRFMDKEILIPVKDDFIEKVDKKNRMIYIKAPEGLIDIYLDENPEE